MSDLQKQIDFLQVKLDDLTKAFVDLSKRADGLQQQIDDIEDAWAEDVRNREYFKDDGE